MDVLVGEPFISTSEYKYQGWKSPWYGKISNIAIFDNPVNISEFREFY